jgi:hypothetical protein
LARQIILLPTLLTGEVQEVQKLEIKLPLTVSKTPLFETDPEKYFFTNSAFVRSNFCKIIACNILQFRGKFLQVHSL